LKKIICIKSIKYRYIVSFAKLPPTCQVLNLHAQPTCWLVPLEFLNLYTHLAHVVLYILRCVESLEVEILKSNRRKIVYVFFCVFTFIICECLFPNIRRYKLELLEYLLQIDGSLERCAYRMPRLVDLSLVF
jgi:hypothetical protein